MKQILKNLNIPFNDTPHGIQVNREYYSYDLEQTVKNNLHRIQYLDTTFLIIPEDFSVLKLSEEGYTPNLSQNFIVENKGVEVGLTISIEREGGRFISGCLDTRDYGELEVEDLILSRESLIEISNTIQIFHTNFGLEIKGRELFKFCMENQFIIKKYSWEETIE